MIMERLKEYFDKPINDDNPRSICADKSGFIKNWEINGN